MRRGHVAVILLLPLLLACSRDTDSNRSPTPLYVTWKTLEIDKLASIWLMKRVVAPDARFEFIADGEPINRGTPFDTPEAEYRRYATMSCFESIVRKHGIQDRGITRLAGIIHDLEINYWARKRFPETDALDQQIRGIIAGHADDPGACVLESSAVFDRFREDIQRGSK